MQSSLKWKLGEKESPSIVIIRGIYVDSTPLRKDQVLLCVSHVLSFQSSWFKSRLPQLSCQPDWSDPWSQMAVTSWQLLSLT